MIKKLKSKLPLFIQSIRNPYLNKIEGVWVMDDFDLEEMKPKVYILTGELSGVTITIRSVEIDENERAKFYVLLEKDGEQYVPKVEHATSKNELTVFIHKILIKLFPDVDIKEG